MRRFEAQVDGLYCMVVVELLEQHGSTGSFDRRRLPCYLLLPLSPMFSLLRAHLPVGQIASCRGLKGHDGEPQV
jgi:hypothetical protein